MDVKDLVPWIAFAGVMYFTIKAINANTQQKRSQDIQLASDLLKDV